MIQRLVSIVLPKVLVCAQRARTFTSLLAPCPFSAVSLHVNAPMSLQVTGSTVLAALQLQVSLGRVKATDVCSFAYRRLQPCACTPAATPSANHFLTSGVVACRLVATCPKSTGKKCCQDGEKCYLDSKGQKVCCAEGELSSVSCEAVPAGCCLWRTLCKGSHNQYGVSF